MATISDAEAQKAKFHQKVTKTHEEAKSAFTGLENKIQTGQKENLYLKENLSKCQMENNDLKSKVTELEQEVRKTHEEAKSAFTDLGNEIETVQKENLCQKEKLSKIQLENNDFKSKATQLEQKVIY